MADVSVPVEIVEWMNARNWGQHHLRWHVERIWDRLPPNIQGWASQQGWSRYPVQEGQETNGLAFLAMHRAMMNMLKSAFPAHVGLFVGWARPPTDPAAPLDPVPPGTPQAFDPNMIESVMRLDEGLSEFDGEDGFGLFIESGWRPFPNTPTRRASDRAAGIHNYLHGRFEDPDSPIDMGDPAVNLQNERFWRLHGWIDARWSAYRTLTGRSDTDADYVALLQEASAHMGHGHLTTAAETVVVPVAIRAEIRRQLFGG